MGNKGTMHGPSTNIDSPNKILANQKGSPISKPRPCRIKMKTQGSTMFLLTFICGLIASTRAQIGDLCACTPSIYEWVLDFSADCGSVILEPQGISGSNCDIDLFNPDLPSDLVPVRVVVIDTLEFGQNMQLVQQTTLFGDYFNGDSFSFVSTTSNPANLTQETVPRALQISMLGEDQNQVPLLMTWIIEFSNACNGQPVFSQGNQYAWTIFVSNSTVYTQLHYTPQVPKRT